jgi:hypothetical protein
VSDLDPSCDKIISDPAPDCDKKLELELDRDLKFQIRIQVVTKKSRSKIGL